MGNTTTNTTNNTNNITTKITNTKTNSNDISYTEWISKIKIKQKEYQLKQAQKIKNDEMDDYQLLIKYLTFTTSIIGYSAISIISRIIRCYLGTLHGVSIFNGKDFNFNGLRISIAIHPICGQIYIADEYQIYQLNEEEKEENQFKIIAKIDNYSKTKITDLSWTPDGKNLICLTNSNLISIHKVIDNQILYKMEYDKMDYLKYDFNHFYFDACYFLNLLNFRDIINAHLNIRTYSTLYTLDVYRKQLWIICNSIQNDNTLSNVVNDDDDNDELTIWNQPILFNIPFEWIYITRNLEILYKEIHNLSQQAMTDIDNNEYEKKLQILQNKIEKLKLERIKNENKIKIIDLFILLKLKEIHQFANINKRCEVNSEIFCCAFDVDKLHQNGGIYIITSNKQFFRIERNENISNKYIDDQSWLNKANKKYPNYFINEQPFWNITHQALLHDVLPDGLPLGICNIRYDSITGRIIVADNYKIQSLYI